ncbi:hypothetical protein [Streptomyces sp. C10-9-1]|uniref:hypothetical protein n=1 Tax=Streptomyces sp. C10-9-1 TaxID=1859285 RepID=UPI003F49FED7
MADESASSIVRKLREQGRLSDEEIDKLQVRVDTLEGLDLTGSHFDTSETHHGSGTHFTHESHHHTSVEREIASQIEGLAD